MLAAIDREYGARDPARAPGREEHDGVRDLFGRTHAPRGNGREHGVVDRSVAALHLVPDAARELDRARSHAIHANAFRGKRDCEVLRVADERCLHRRVGWRARRLERRRRRDVDDGSAAGFLEPGHDPPRGAHRSHHVDLETELPGALVVADAEARGVVHQHVGTAERGPRALEEGVESRGIGHVADLGVHLHPPLAQLAGGVLQRLGAARTEGDVAALGSERQRRRAPDAAAAARHDRGLALESQLHGVSSATSAAAAPRRALRCR